jgi:glucosamine-6-phosphate deaminase
MKTQIIRTFSKDELIVDILKDRQAIGELSARYISELIHETLQEKEETRIVFAAAPSQNEFLEELTSDPSIDWSRVVAFHMDEYIGLPISSDKLFSTYLYKHIFSRVKCKMAHLIDSQEEDSERMCQV